jgi:hypothetical protein
MHHNKFFINTVVVFFVFVLCVYYENKWSELEPEPVVHQSDAATCGNGSPTMKEEVGHVAAPF